MRNKWLMKAVSLAVSLQMVCAVIPQLSLTVSAEANYYLNEDCSSLDKWKNPGKAEVLTEGGTDFIRYQSDESSPTVASRDFDTKLTGNEIYIAELDVRFSDENSGVIELYGGSALGPGILFNGSDIQAMTGGSKYVDMYKGAEADKWYNIKFIANGYSSMNAYTTDIGSNTSQSTIDDLRRNIKDAAHSLSKINLTNQLTSVKKARMGAVDVRNIKVYKAVPKTVAIGGGVDEVSVPQTDTASTAQFTVASATYGDIDMTSYALLDQGILSFKLYDETDTDEVTPTGISINSSTGVLSVDKTANTGTYTVRLESYEGSVYDSVQIGIVPMGEADKVEFVNAPAKIPVPSAGETKTPYSVKVTDQTGSEIDGAALSWSLTDTSGNTITNDKLTIDANGVVTAKSGAPTENVRIKAETAGKSAVTEPVEVYNMTATTISISGDDYFAVGSAPKTYTAKIFDQNGIEMPEETAKSWKSDNSGVSIDNGVLTVPSGTADAEITITVTSSEVQATTKVKVYNPMLSKISIDGDRSIEIPKSGTKNFAYTAAAVDQYGFTVSGVDFKWTMTAYDNTAISLNGSIITAGAGAKEQTVTLAAASGEVKGEFRAVVTENPFNYKPVDGGFEIDVTKSTNSNNYTRPIYPPHINDNLLGTPPSRRFIYYLGDRPKLALTSVEPHTNPNTYKRYAHMFIGIKDGKWLDEMSNITSRYVYGHEEYEITDDSFDGTIKLTYTRSNDLDAMLVKAELPDSIKDKIVVAAAGQGGARASQPTGGNSANINFVASDAAVSEVDSSKNTYHIIGDANVSINGTASVPMNYTVKDASSYQAEDVNSLLNSSESNKSMVVGTTEGNTENEIYWLITTESADNEYIEKFKTDAKTMFNDGVKYYKAVSQMVKVDTPDPYINAAITAQVMATDASWDSPVITHGPMGWHVAFGGWRSHYGFVDGGWGERIKSNAKKFMKTQHSDGRIQAYANKDDRYNMGIVLVDGLLQYWEWSGDDDFFANEGGYDFVAGHLRFMDTYMQVPGTNLYENWLDAWNTDNKWNNGAAGSIASAYTWRAYNTMAKLAAKLGKADDAAAYQEKADKIKADMNAKLWDEDTGVFGEYRERFGQDRINTAPDLSSVYTPIDMGIATREQGYQMLRFTDYAVPSVANQDSIWQGIDFKYSSNRPPEFYSSDGLYIQEVMNNALAYYENGQRDMAMKQLRACLVPLMKGRNAAGQGVAGHVVRASLENNGHIDFADTSTQYVRTAVEGLFGIKMNVPDGIADITPGFPEDWKYASIKTNYLSYDYKYDTNTDVFNISSDKSLSYVMHIPARSSKIESVKVNGSDAAYTVDRFVNIAAPAANSAVVEVKYADEEIAKAEASEIGGADSEYTVKSNGIITDLSDPQGVIDGIPALNKGEVTVKLAKKEGNHTFFVTVKKNDMTAVLPVDVLINSSIEITDTQIISGSNPGISVKLTNNTEAAVTIKAELSTVSGKTTADLTIPAKASSNSILVPVQKSNDLTPGNNKVTAVITGDINKTITGEATDWQLKSRITNTEDQYKTISLGDAVNQDLRTLHENKYDLTYEGNEHYRLPNFSWSSDTTRTVLANGRSWWEHGANAVPASLSLPSDGGVFKSDIGVPFEISSNNGNNAAFVSLYNQFPDKMNIPVNTDGSKLYFMLSVSTNNMQSRIENARITVNFADGTNEVLPLTNPDNIDDWLNYQQASPYAESGYAQILGEKAHSNIIALDLGKAKHIKSVDFECLASEVIAGLLGITVVEGEVTDEPLTGLTVGKITFDKDSLSGASYVAASVSVANNTKESVSAELVIAHYAADGGLKYIKASDQTIDAGSNVTCTAVYDNAEFDSGDYVKAFLWGSMDTMNPLTAAALLRNN